MTLRWDGNAERTARHALRRDVERAMREGDGVRASTPIGADRHPDFVIALLHVACRDRLHGIADDRDRRLAVEARGDLHHHGIAGGVVLLVGMSWFPQNTTPCQHRLTLP